MSYSWYRVESSRADHPKVLALELLLKEPLALAYVDRLHNWTHRFAISGRFGSELVGHMETMCRWKKEEGKLLAAFIKVGLVDKVRGGYETHDWAEFQGALVEKSNRDAEVKRKRREERRARGAKPARAEKAPGAKAARLPNLTDGRDVTDVTRRDVTDGRSDQPPVSEPTIVEAVEPPRQGLKKNWARVAEQLAANLIRRRELAGNLPPDRDADLAAIREWALAWVLKHEPDDRQLDVMHEAFNAFVADPWAIERGCALALWVSENVWEPRWNDARAKAAA